MERWTVSTKSRGRVRRILSNLGIRTPRLIRGARLNADLGSTTLTTERLVIRPHRLADADAWYAIQSDDNVTRFLSWPRRTRGESRRHLKDRTRHTSLSQVDDLLALAIEHEGRLVGDISVHLRTVHPDFRSAEIGWLLASDRGGAGLAAEAVHAVMEILFERLTMRWFFAIVDQRNVKSLALATRLGFSTFLQDGPVHTMIVTPQSLTKPVAPDKPSQHG